MNLRDLTPAPRRQDHTTSPYASGAFVLRAFRVHRIPPRVRDDRDPPLATGETRGVKLMICPTAREEYFCSKGWTDFCRFARRVILSRFTCLPPETTLRHSGAMQ